MADRPPVSVLLPTTRWTDACTEVDTQLRDHDELLIIHDIEDDPVTDRQHTPEGVRLIAAGEPEHCSGKANAIATGMEAAHHDRFVWTDDDFHHPRTGWRPLAPRKPTCPSITRKATPTNSIKKAYSILS